MPSLRQKVTTYFRQLSFIAEPREGTRSPRKSGTDDDGNFITKYLEGRMQRIFTPGPEIYNGQNPTDLPDLKIGHYSTGPHSITAACTGPDEGLTGIKRSKLHLSASYADDIDFIDTTNESDSYEVRHSINTNTSKLVSNSRTRHSTFSRSNTPRKLSSTNLVNDQSANKTSGSAAGGTGGMRSRKNSRTSISNINASNQIGNSNATKNTNSKAKTEDNNNKSTTIVVSMVSTKLSASTHPASDQNNQNALNAINSEANLISKAATLTASKTNSNTAVITETAEVVAISAHGQIETVTTKSLENTTERLLQEAVSSQIPISKDFKAELIIAQDADAVASVTNWKMESEYAYGISVSLYENNMLTKEPMGNPIADCYGMVAHGNSSILALADGVNWGDGARLAARSAVHGCLDYLDRAIFGMAPECMATTTQEVFVSLLRSMWEGHGCILEVGGALSTLTIAVVLPLSKIANNDEGLEGAVEQFVVCACNVGDSLGYIYSKKHGVREFTQASHDITSMRDMRDALGALGPADGNKPELSNLTLSMTIIDKGDIVFLTSDGVSDNFDPVVGKFAEAWTPDVKLMSTHRHNQGGILAPKRQNKSASALYSRLHTSTTESVQQPLTPPAPPSRTKKLASSVTGSSHSSGVSNAPSRPKYMRSQTVIEPRRLSASGNPSIGLMRHQMPSSHITPKIPRSISGLPLVTGPQRHALMLYRLEDLLSYGINGTFSPSGISARRLCHLLIDFVRMITSARRKTLEQRELFYKLATGPDGIKREVELNRMQHRATRKRVVDSSAFISLPGKLDHATVVAFTAGGECEINSTTTQDIGGVSAPLQSKEFEETDF